MNNQSKKTHPQKQNFKKITQVQPLSLTELDSVVGGSVYKVPDVTLKRGQFG